MTLNIVCDFDGTIAPIDVTDLVLEHFADPAWLELEAAWKAGQLASRTCMERQVALLRCSRSALDALLDDVDIDPAFPAFVRDCQSRGHKLTVVSDGLDYAINRIMRRHKIPRVAVFANRMVQTSLDRYRLEFPFGSETCGSGVCKCRFRAHAGPTLLIGDGRSDFCIAGVADVTIAKGALLERCRRDGLPVLPFDTFADVRAVVDRLLPQPLQASHRSIEWSSSL